MTYYTSPNRRITLFPAFPALIIFSSLVLTAGISSAQPVSETGEYPVISSEADAPDSELTRERYPSDFDPFIALPLPPAWHETEGFADTNDVLSQQLATEDQVRVRVDLRLPAVETERLDETQAANWALDQEDAAAELLASLPSGTYEVTDQSLLDSSLYLDLQNESLKVLSDSILVANVSKASIPSGFTNTRIDPPNNASYGYFGHRVRQSGDVALIYQDTLSCYWCDDARFYLFRRINDVWYEDKRELVGQQFTTALEGNLVAVGKPYAEPTGLTDEGDITVYHWDGSYWNTESLSLPTEHRQAGAMLGYSVAISGNTLAAGAPGWDLLNDGNGNRYDNVGRVYVWVRQIDGQWLFQTAIDNQRTPPNVRQDDYFGYMVRLSEDTLLVNLKIDSYSGIIDIWDRTNTSWIQAQTIPWSFSNYYSDGIDDIAFNGTFAVIGKGGNNEVQVWRRAGGKGTAFNLTTTLTAADGSPGNAFGSTLALAGNRIVIGAPEDTRGSLGNAGAAYVYRLVGAAWVPEIKVMAEPAYEGDQLGYSVALSGNTLLIGAPYNEYVTSRAGTVYTYELPITLSINDVTQAEGHSGNRSYIFMVTLNAVSSTPVTVQYVTANGTATAGSDYTSTSGTLTIPAGQLSKQISVQVKGDTAMEANETFYVNLSVPTGATLADAQGLGTITNDDNRNLRINDVTKAEGNSGVTPFTFTVSLNAISSAPVTVKYVTANGTATAGSDYAATSGTLTIPAGQISKTVTINVIGDTTDEANEKFYVNLSAPTGATLADAQGLGTITNDDGNKPDFVVTAITFNPPTPAANTAFTATITVKNQGTSAANGGWLDVYTNQSTTPGCGTDGNKYQSVGTLAAGASKTITFSGLSTRKASSRTFRAFVDSYCQTGEANEGNNQLTKPY